jgi:diaminopimelate epimerase
MDFAKLHGTGNDFVVLDARRVERDWTALARTICNRHFGVGGDGMILATPSTCADIRMRILNADGSEAEMSGNGMRCLAKFVVDAGIVTPRDGEFDVETGAGVLRVRVTTEGGRVKSVREGMGKPHLDPRDIPVAIEAAPPVRSFDLRVNGLTLPVTPVSMGNPHAVYFQGDPVEAYPLHDVGPLVERHELFPKRTNFEVVRMLGPDVAEMRVWERGVGETLSCGSGASATMVAARLRDLAGDRLELRVPGGVLHLEWDGEGEVILTGPVEESFRGSWPG